MSRTIHYTSEWLEYYNKRLSKILQNPQETLCVASSESKPALIQYSAKGSVEVPFRAAEGKQSKTEEKYNREILGGVGRFEAVTLHLPGGGRYTPDFMTIDDGVVTFHEVKGSYRLGSQGRAYTAFHDAAAYYPMWRFVWAHWTGKEWECKTFPEIR